MTTKFVSVALKHVFYFSKSSSDIRRDNETMRTKGEETLKNVGGGGGSMEQDGFHGLVVELTLRMIHDEKKNKEPSRAFMRSKSLAFQTLLTYPQELSLSSSSSTSSLSSISSSLSLRERALATLYSVAEVIPPEIPSTSEISDYQLVPFTPKSTLFRDISDLVEKWISKAAISRVEDDGVKDYVFVEGVVAEREHFGGLLDHSPLATENRKDASFDDDVFSKTILSLSALARTSTSSPPSSSLTSLYSTAMKDETDIGNPLLGSQSFFCSQRLLQRGEEIFNADPGVSHSGLLLSFS